MDNLTHTLVGAALGRAGLQDRTGLAMPTLMIGANLPDLDVLAIPFGHGLDFRRGWTHGVLALAVLPFALLAVMTAWDRWVRRPRDPLAEPVHPRWLLTLATLAILTHPALDWLNTYGLRWLMPFDGTWFYGDGLFIVDPWVWLALGLGLWLSRRGSAGGAKRRPARIALAATAAYALSMVIGAAAAERWIARQLPARGIAAARSVLASPVPVDPFRRSVVVETADGYVFGDLTWWLKPDLTLAPSAVPRGNRHPAVAIAREHPQARRFLTWSRYPLYEVSESAAGARVHISDARYGSSADDSWASVSVWVPAARPGER